MCRLYMDKLHKLFEMQSAFDKSLPKKLTMDEAINMKCTAIIHEAVELREHSNWKWWKNDKEYDENAAREEFADILHFVLSLAISMGITPNELMTLYTKKHKINKKRQVNGY